MIEVICGPMYSGKSEELIRRLVRAEIAGKNVLAFKPSLDTRYGFNQIDSHSGSAHRARAVDHSWEVEKIREDTDVVGIDEAQFFDADLPTYVELLSSHYNKQVIVSGLDMTFRKEPFGPMPHLLAIADKVQKLTAVCHKCGADAIYTQRLIDGHAAPFDGPTVQVGALDSYEARCHSCFEPA